MDCEECEKKDKRIAELERMVQNMAESYDAARNSEVIDFFAETGVDLNG
jgi:hypothetical protein